MIETATRADVPRIMEMARDMHAESRFAKFPFDGAKMERIFCGLIDGAGTILLYRKEAQTVGMAVLQTSEMFFSTSLMAFEYGIFVEPEHRGSFGALGLVKSAKAWARARGAVWLDLGITTGVTADRSGAFYEALGARQVGALYSIDLGE